LLRTNILANLAGSGWIAFLTLVATPIQIHLLGVEAYGLVGLITVLQVVFGTLDLGLSASVTQTIASDRSPGRSESAVLTNSVGSIYSLMAVVIGGLLWLAAGWIATRWLKPQALDGQTVLYAVRAIGLYVAFRWPIAFYTGVLNGIQRMDVLNLLKASAGTVRIIVGTALIISWPSITLFLGWFAASALLELIAFSIAAHRLVPEIRPSISISMAAVRSVWRFSLTLAAIAFLSVLVTQMDRLFVSKMMSLQSFGYYSLAATAAAGISLLQISINNASMPAFAEAASHGKKELAARYAKVSELTAFAVALPCFLVATFAPEILRLWVNQAAARGAGIPLALLLGGFFVNAAVSSAYLSSVATRNAAIPAVVNGVGALLYLPLLYVLTKSFGIAGAATGWVVLNIYYLPTLVPAVHRKILNESVLPWAWHGFAAPLVAALVAIGSMKALAVAIGNPIATWTAFALAIPLYALIAYPLISPSLRKALSPSNAIASIFPRRASSR
jgi:O-antigen/teichoic acid export membrane protein